MSSDPIRILRVIARLNVGGPALQIECPSHRVDGAREFHEHRVACKVHEPTPMLPDLRFDQVGAQGIPGAQRSELVRLNEARPASDIREGHRGEASRNAFHVTCPSGQREGHPLML